MVKQTIAGIFNQIEHLLKTSVTAVVRVWYHGGIMLAAEFRQAP